MLFLITAAAHAAPGYLRTPDIHEDTVVFSAEGDLWVAPVAGGAASRITRAPGTEIHPRFSPDGKTIAFTGDYDGNAEVYLVDVGGGEPRRLTWWPGSDEVIGWLDAETVLFRTRERHPHRSTELFAVPAAGGDPRQLPLGWATRLDVDPDSGRWAFNRLNREHSTWKRYRGGTAADVWVGHPDKADYARVTDFEGIDGFPMWHDGRIYLLADQGGTGNLWSILPDGTDRRRHTDHGQWDARWPAMGPDGRIVYMLAGDLWLFDPATDETSKLAVELPSDRVRTRVRYPDASKSFTWAALSPKGDRVLYTTRGEIFGVSVEPGVTVPLTGGSASRESWGAFSPDGSRVVYVTDRDGEEAIVVADAWGRGEPKVVSPPGDRTWHFPPVFSPDGRQIAWSDHTQTLYVGSASGGVPVKVARSAQDEIRHYRFSPDGRYLAYDAWDDGLYRSVWIWDSRSKRSTRVTSETTDDHSPAWSRDGKYLFFIGERHVSPVIGQRDFSYVLTESGRPYALPLREGVGSPFAEDAGAPPGVGEVEEGRRALIRLRRKRKLGISDDDEASVGPITIDFDGIADRAVRFPMDPGQYQGLSAGKDKVYVLRSRVSGMNDDLVEPPKGADLVAFDLEEREAEVVRSDVRGFELGADGETVLALHEGGKLVVLDGKESEDVDLGGIVLELDPRAEWAQMFREAWRLQRDFYWDAGMAGVDWEAEWKKYAPLLPRLSTRGDLDDLIGELIGELATSHTYAWGGDVESGPKVGIGMIGADVVRDGEGYRVTRIYRGDPADGVRSPLGEPGVGVGEGDTILQVNHRPFPAQLPFTAAFSGLADRSVVLTVRAAGARGSRDVVVELPGSDKELRYVDWVRQNRERVAEASKGRFGYLHLPDMGRNGLVAFEKWFYPQLDKEGLVVDVRWNGGGFVSQLILERLRRKLISYDRARGGGIYRYPAAVLNGPFVVLLNEWAGSDGDIFPASVQAEGLAPVIGRRSWGGVVGIRGDKPLTDGGVLTEPEYAFWWPKQGWGIENHGVDPDIVVDNLPQELARGVDAQLDRGVVELQRLWEEHPPVKPDFGPVPDKSRGAYSEE